MVDGTLVLFIARIPCISYGFERVDLFLNELFFILLFLLILKNHHGDLSIEVTLFFHESVHLLHHELPSKTHVDPSVLVNSDQLVVKVRPGLQNLLEFISVLLGNSSEISL